MQGALWDQKNASTPTTGLLALNVCCLAELKKIDHDRLVFRVLNIPGKD